MTLRPWPRRLALISALTLTAISLPLAFPSPLFAYVVTQDGLSIHSDESLPVEKVNEFLSDVRHLLEASAFDLDEFGARIYVPNSGWRWNLFWAFHRGGNVAFVVHFSPNPYAVLPGADFDNKKLVTRTGYRPEGRRTLTYYVAHELTHLLTARRIGAVRTILMPEWIREGVADYVAMPKEDAARIYSEIGDRTPDLAMMNENGVYAPYRLLVTYFLEEEGWTLDELLSSDLSLAEARSIAHVHLDQDQPAASRQPEWPAYGLAPLRL